MTREARRGDLAQPLVAGVVCGVVGFSGAFPVVIAGLRGVGATTEQAASGLLALCLAMAVGTVLLSVRQRMPVAVAWSTPGAALLATTGVPDGGWAAAVGAFCVCGALLALTGLWRALGRWIGLIPAPLAAAMLAGVLLPLCIKPVESLVELPWLTAPVVLTWAVLLRFARLWAVPAALVVAGVAIWVDGPPRIAAAALAPALDFTAPAFEVGALIGIALPLFIVTMASQNITGMGVLATYGYRPDFGSVLRTTGVSTVAGAPFGGHAVNLAAISAALVAGPDAHPDPARRWVAGLSAGATHVLLGLGAAAATAFLAASPFLLVEAVAGLALLGALGGALTAAMADDERREAALITLVVTASGIAVLGIGGAFWGLVAGLVFAWWRTGGAKRENAAA